MEIFIAGRKISAKRTLMTTTTHTSVSIRVILLALILSSLSILPARAIGRILYVKHNATGANNGSSWINAYTSLQSALAYAASGDEVWVAAGTYKPTQNTNRTVSFTLKNGVSIYGGFGGTETARSQRNPATSVTILSGDIGIAGNNGDNAFHVVNGGGTNRTAILDGFTVTAGNAKDLSTIIGGSGGGMLNDRSSPTLANLIFRDNTAYLDGGGMYNVNYSSPSLTNVTFSANTSNLGGGMSNYYGNPVLRNVTFIGNSHSGMDNYRSNVTLINVAFINNTSDYHGGGMYSVGESTQTLINVTFSGNTATNAGGGISASADTRTILTNVTFNNNSAFAGGAMYLFFATADLTNVTLSDNTATHGNEIYNETSTITIRNSIVWNEAFNVIVNRGSLHITHSVVAIVDGPYIGTDNVHTDPMLDPLANNGGLTKTMSLGTNSSALNKGNDADCPSTDQRGVPRPQGAHCDIGAYEESYISVSGNAGVAGVAIEYYDTQNTQSPVSSTVISSENGSYSFAIPPSWTGWVRPAHPCFTFNPAMRQFSHPGTSITAQDFVPTFVPAAECADVNITIGTATPARFGLAVGTSTRASFTGANNGPVQIGSTNNVPLIGAERVIYKVNGVNTSFTEMMGLPENQVDTTYWLPWYNNVDLDTQLRFANS
jgi:predicted outer membrane repeat protein